MSTPRTMCHPPKCQALIAMAQTQSNYSSTVLYLDLVPVPDPSRHRSPPEPCGKAMDLALPHPCNGSKAPSCPPLAPFIPRSRGPMGAGCTSQRACNIAKFPPKLDTETQDSHQRTLNQGTSQDQIQDLKPSVTKTHGGRTRWSSTAPLREPGQRTQRLC